MADSADEDAYVPALTAQGYRLHLREPDWEQHRVMKGDDPLVNLHVFTVGSRELERMWRSATAAATTPRNGASYEETKRESAIRC